MASIFHGKRINPPDTPKRVNQPPMSAELIAEGIAKRSRGVTWRAIGRKAGYTEGTVRQRIIKAYGSDPCPEHLRPS